MTLDSILALLRRRAGIDPESLGSKIVPLAVTTRQRTLGFSDLGSYAQHLRENPDEIDALIDDLVVPETWFFRGGELFRYLAETVRERTSMRRERNPVRLLSIPCSTGEEPYSLAMALVDLQIPRQAWHIDAVDISARHLERAQRGVYSEFSFRQTDQDIRARFFEPVDSQWQINGRLRAAVHFRQGNLVDRDFLADQLPYDVILCRNLLIYLHDEARRQVVATLDRLLAPGGLIAMGHAEPLDSIDRRFAHVGPDGLFLFGRAGSAEQDATAAATLVPHSRRSAPQETRVSAKRKPAIAAPGKARRPITSDTRQSPQPASAPVQTAPIASTIARDLADAGRLDAARAECQAQLAASGPSAELYTILGIVHKSGGQDEESKRCFEKALYLQPDHGEALLHLMLLYEQEGAHRQAAALRGRLERTTRGGDA